jgi:amidohydrolase
MASLLGTMRVLQEVRPLFGGTVICIFQPGEEKFPGGASILIQEEALENPKPGLIIGQHVSPEIPAGSFGIKSGKFMASGDEIHIEVTGRGGHAALPDKTTDTVRIAAEIIVELKSYIEANSSDDNPSLLSFGKIIADGATNVVPGRVTIEGTFRTFNEKWRKRARAEMEKRAGSIAERFKGSCRFRIMDGYPVLINDETYTPKVMKWLEHYAGKENLINLPARLTAEDFGYYSRVAPIVFYRLGTGFDSNDEVPSLHSPGFLANEEALVHGAGAMAWIALTYLEKQ